MLIKATINDRVRILLNEIVQGFWLSTEIDKFIDDAAIDISTRTYCYEQSYTVAFINETQIYTPSISDVIKTLGVIFRNKGLKKATPWMEGIESAVSIGVPKYYFEILNKIGFFPIPTLVEAGESATVYCAITTSSITNIPLRFQVPAVLYSVYLALLKQRHYAKAAQVFNNYIDSLNLYRGEIARENIIEPPPQNQYILKIQPQVQGIR